LNSEARGENPVSFLELRNVSKDFGGLRVLDNLSFDVQQGTLHAIVGPNGAGKTTLFNLISGFLKPTGGAIYFKGQNISKIPSHRMAHLGMRRSFQVLTLFNELTVLENVRLAIQARSKRNFSFFSKASELPNMTQESHDILKHLGLADVAQHKATELSHGQQRYLDIGIAIAGGGEVLLLDEPTSGLVYDEIPQMGETIKRLTPSMTVLLIEHRIEMVLAISDRITVLDYGSVIADGPPDAVRGDEKVSKAYLGLN
jgi:branched-chain amino acid transport system ATP-binding protein